MKKIFAVLGMILWIRLAVNIFANEDMLSLPTLAVIAVLCIYYFIFLR